jgi:hypothetical protein
LFIEVEGHMAKRVALFIQRVNKGRKAEKRGGGVRKSWMELD